jgi:hypothetical protein
MGKREFEAALKPLMVKGRLSVKKLEAVPDEQREKMLLHIVRHRAPLIQEFCNRLTDRRWLACMGYLYETKGERYTFIHTCEHEIK